MSRHSVVDAKNNLSDLIARAEKGEEVVITRHGQPVVELRAVKRTPRKITQADLDWLDANRITLKGGPIDWTAEIRAMRDAGY